MCPGWVSDSHRLEKRRKLIQPPTHPPSSYRTLRPHLLQPGQHVRRWHSPNPHPPTHPPTHPPIDSSTSFEPPRSPPPSYLIYKKTAHLTTHPPSSYRTLRPHLLQPGQHVRRWHSPNPHPPTHPPTHPPIDSSTSFEPPRSPPPSYLIYKKTAHLTTHPPSSYRTLRPHLLQPGQHVRRWHSPNPHPPTHPPTHPPIDSSTSFEPPRSPPPSYLIYKKTAHLTTHPPSSYRTLRPHLLQPGQHVRRWHSPNRRRYGLLHCRR